MENAKMKTATRILVRIWMMAGTALILFFVFSSADLLDISFCGIIACYGIIEFFIKCLEEKYWPERNTGKISKMIAVVLIVLIFIKFVLIR